MAALTSAGLLPITDPSMGYLVVYTRANPRVAANPNPTVTALLNGGSGTSGGSTTVPIVPAFTKFPVSP
jgi:hypothetical protein